MVNEKKLKATIAYLAKDRQFGKLQIFKLLYIADFSSYARRGVSITEETYENFEMGPVPRAAWRNLERYAEITEVIVGAPQPKMWISARADADLSVLSEEDVAILNETLDKYGHLSGAQLRELTHKEIPYRATLRREEIPYYLAPYRTVDKPTNKEIDFLLKDPEYVAAITQGE